MLTVCSMLTRRGWWLAVVVGVLVLLAPAAPAAPVTAQSDEALPAIEWLDDCQFDPSGEFPFLLPDNEIPLETLDCGVLLTFEDPFDAESNIIEIAFVVLFAENPSNPDPIVYLEGGPGGSGVLTIDAWVQHPLRENYDLVLVDQRGTGFSYPSLVCSLIPEAADAEDDVAYFEACAADLRDQGVDFSTYNTVNNATDIAYLITALQSEFGYSRVNLLGGSYGTRLGLALLRDWPELIRSAVLDGLYPPELDAYATDHQRTVDALLTLLDFCAADANCNGAFPDLEDSLLGAIEALYDEPYYIEEEDFDLTGGDLVYSLFEAQYDISVVPILPAVIDLVGAGEIEDAIDLLFEGPPGYEDPYVDVYTSYSEEDVDAWFETVELLGDADGMFMLLECQDEVAFSVIQEPGYTLAPLPDFVPTDLQLDLIDAATALVEDCDLWFEAAAPVRESERAQSAVPTLLLSGGLDPITPPAYGDSALLGLSNGQHVVVPFAAHGVIDAGPCPLQIMLDFYAEPAAPLDTSCIAEMTLEFYTP